MRMMLTEDTVTISATTYKLISPKPPHSDWDGSYLELDIATQFIDSNSIYRVKVVGMSENIAALLPTVPVDGNEYVPLNIVYNGSAWWYAIGAVYAG